MAGGKRHSNINMPGSIGLQENTAQALDIQRNTAKGKSKERKESCTHEQ